MGRLGGLFRDVVELLDQKGATAAAHTYASCDTSVSSSRATLGGRRTPNSVYRDFLQAVPRSMRHLPAFITADPTGPWADRLRKDHSSGVGWIGAVYEEIAGWNHQPEYPPVRCVALSVGGENGSSLAGKTGAHAISGRRAAISRADVVAYAAEQGAPQRLWVTLTDVPLSPAPGGGEEETVGRISPFSRGGGRRTSAGARVGLAAGGSVWRRLRQGWLPEYGQDEGIMLLKLPTIVER